MADLARRNENPPDLYDESGRLNPSPATRWDRRAPVRQKRSSILEASLWMVGITLLLSFFPLVNGLIGGLVGGSRAGSPGRAVKAALLPAIVSSIGVWLLLTAFNLPVIGIAAGFATALLVAAVDLGIFAGALIGGYWAQSKDLHRRA